MFTNLERTMQFVKYFQNSEKIKLTQEWRKIIEIMSFKEAAVKFYDSLIDHWHIKVCVLWIFPSIFRQKTCIESNVVRVNETTSRTYVNISASMVQSNIYIWARSQSVKCSDWPLHGHSSEFRTLPSILFRVWNKEDAFHRTSRSLQSDNSSFRAKYETICGCPR